MQHFIVRQCKEFGYFISDIPSMTKSEYWGFQEMIAKGYIRSKLPVPNFYELTEKYYEDNSK